MNKLLAMLFICLCLQGCNFGEDNCENTECYAGGGGGTYGTGDGTPDTSGPYEGQVLLGPVIGATVTVHKLFDENETILCEVTTSTAMDLNKGGTFSLPSSCVANADIFYVITSTGGYDIDKEDDGIIDATPTEVTQVIHTVVLGSSIYEVEGWKVNRITELFYQFALFARDKLKFTHEQLLKTMPLFAAEHISQDLDDVVGIDYKDVMRWNPRFHQDLIDFGSVDSPEVFFKGFWNDLKPAATKPLNDTAVTVCSDYRPGNVWGDLHNSQLNCADFGVTAEISGVDGDGDPIPAGQDAHFGRDATFNDDSDGVAGFSFTKIDASGAPLPAEAEVWSCVLDNVTGLMWEVKTTDEGLQDNSHTYTWYNSTGVNDGGDHGIGDTGIATTTGYEIGSTQETGYPNKAGSDNCYNASRCDTEKYAEDVNGMNNGDGLCGYSGWRLPTRSELVSLVAYDRSGKAIDSNYFPNEGSSGYMRTWTSTVERGFIYAYRYRQVSIIQFSLGGAMDESEKLTHALVRLVRVNTETGD